MSTRCAGFRVGPKAGSRDFAGYGVGEVWWRALLGLFFEGGVGVQCEV